VTAFEWNGGKGTVEYYAWANMKTRCYNPNYFLYFRYGGRGIKVCDEWVKSFTKFLEDVGEKPTKDHSLDRIDNNGDYEPNNVRWATKKQQTDNRRSTILVTVGDVTLPLIDWCHKTGVQYKTAHARIKRGWTRERAIGL
jgi:hypothetical protein